jgi:hypothetical protein
MGGITAGKFGGKGIAGTTICCLMLVVMQPQLPPPLLLLLDPVHVLYRIQHRGLLEVVGLVLVVHHELAVIPLVDASSDTSKVVHNILWGRMLSDNWHLEDRSRYNLALDALCSLV